MDADWLVAILNVEFLVVHSFPFLLMVVLQRPRLPQWQGLRGLAFGLLLLMYVAGAHDLAGWQGVGLFLSLAGVTYLGFFVRFDEGIHKFPGTGSTVALQHHPFHVSRRVVSTTLGRRELGRL